MTTYDCAHKGHHYHEADGSIYTRHNGRGKGLIPVVCCHCGTFATVEGWGKQPKPAPLASVIPCKAP